MGARGGPVPVLGGVCGVLPRAGRQRPRPWYYVYMSYTTAATAPHCSGCATTDTEDLTTGDQGYTACCNEYVCDGGQPVRWVVGTMGLADGRDVRTVTGELSACCGGMADRLAAAQGPGLVALSRKH